MSRRRARRMRPATPEEQRQVEEFTKAADIALSAPTMAERRQALNRMRRLADRLTDPGRLANLTAAELHDTLTERCADDPEQVRNL
ncbi:hypothetical protein [Micromonospora tulbaghiae]|uniref:hypothetical protein n=1 Tax=Micromonospora tulbaghiae TaxID=479978 RepID=UPI003EBB8454